MNPTDASDTIVQEITIKAPAERIFEALTNPDQRLKWWGAEGQYRGTQVESDLCPGGKWMTRGVGRGGKPFSGRGEYRQIERPNPRLVTSLPDWGGNASSTLAPLDLGGTDGAPSLR